MFTTFWKMKHREMMSYQEDCVFIWTGSEIKVFQIIQGKKVSIKQFEWSHNWRI